MVSVEQTNDERDKNVALINDIFLVGCNVMVPRNYVQIDILSCLLYLLKKLYIKLGLKLLHKEEAFVVLSIKKSNDTKLFARRLSISCRVYYL